MFLKNRKIKENTFFFLIYQYYTGVKARIIIAFHITQNNHV